MLVLVWVKIPVILVCWWLRGTGGRNCPRDLDLAVGTRVPDQKYVGELLFVSVVCLISSY